ncbi:hypothetical protein TrRE_jg1604 [Triparma retinervis]|uniref:Myosin heavy chain n=1 Tax=Triparma retinervis TaxID=2557542 RepID=A0A9W6ZM87_9STRA|nr:hypothetical protein TrRE_jg1604 [Triparma retinervis]
MIKLNDLNENSILHNLRIRFKLDKIYTSVSSILISVNPFKMLPLYTPEIMESYVNGIRGKDPHVFAIGYQAYNNMMSENSNQSVIISGESGAGKSEATKLILQFLSDLSGRAASTKAVSNIEQQILQANPIMEAFGNAKTVRNNNSSRFGKLITVKFKGGSIHGASIINYLLEKSRVVMQSKGERNYHIFYQLLAAADCNATLKTELNLESPDFYDYVNKSGVTSIDGVSDEKEFDDLVSAMDALHFTEEEKLSTWKIVASVLKLGNVKFDVDVKGTADDGAKISNFDVLESAATLIGCDAKALEKALCFRNVGNRSVILVSYSVKEAETMRDALVKTIYGEVFQWLINRINTTIDTPVDSPTIIGVLDIFGFECFVRNSFEQMCINYCNEKLQFHFNEHIFRLEQEMYAAEGVVVPSTDFKDNQPTLDLLEAPKGQGIFAMIDEEINVPKGSDTGFLNKATAKHAKHPNFEKPKPKACEDAANCFGVVHYAGTVYYNVANFLEKNKDSLHPDVMSTLRASNMNFLTEVLPKPPPTTPGRRGGKSSKKTLGSQFKQQQQDLMDTLNATYPHFVRCMKPNTLLKGSVFQEDLMLAQLRYSGLLEVCRIRKLGFPVRRDFDDFFKRYKAIAPSATDLDGLLAILEGDGKLPKEQFQKGKTKVFMRNAIAQDLEIARDEALLAHALKVQTLIRGFVMRVKFKSWHNIIAAVGSAVAARDEALVTSALDQCAELPFHGVHLKVVKEAKVLQQRLVEEKEVASLLTNAIEQRDLDVLRSAVSAANAMDPPLVHDALNNAAAIIKELEAELALRAELRAAVNKRDLALIDELLLKAETMNLDCEEVNQANALKQRLEEEKEAMENLRTAIDSRDIKALSAFLATCAEMGLSGPDVTEGRKLEEALLAEASAKKALSAAIAERKIQSIESAMKKATDVGVTDSSEFSDASALLKVLQEEKAVTEELAAATSARDASRINAALAKADSLSMKSSEYSNAVAMKDALKKEDDCKAALEAATSSGDAGALSAALATASSIGLSGAEVTAATEALSKAGAASAMSGKLLSCNTSTEAEIEALLKEADGMGLSGSSEYVAAQASLAKAKEAAALVGKLLQEGQTFAVMTKLMAEAELAGLATRYPSEMAQATEALQWLAMQDKVETNLESANASKDLDAMNTWLKYAADNNISSEKVKQGTKNKIRLEKELEVIAKITAAIDSNDIEALKKLIEEADKKGIVGDKVSQGKVLADREKIISETMAKIKKADEESNMELMNEAFDMVIQLGLEGPEIEEAKAKKDALNKVDACSKTLAAAIKTLSVKIYSKGGIVEGDNKPLLDAIADAETNGLPATHRTLVGAKDLVEKMEKQLLVQKQCLDALESGEKSALKAALKAADDLELQLQSKDDIKVSLKEIRDHENMLLEEAGGVTEAPDMGELDPEELEVEREERRKEAMNTKYRFWNFSSLRSPDDYAKGILLSKKKVKEGMLKWQDTLIPKSLLDLSKDNSKLANNINRCLLGYMGDKQMSFPATLAHDILTKGLESPLLRDEVYMQLMKQLSHNPKADSIAKGWQLMCMCVSTFPPSEDFDKFVMNFILSKVEGVGAVKNYAKYCLRTLEGMLTSGASGFVPSVEEIQAYKERPPILASIELVDGQILSEDLPVTPDLAVGKVTEICSHFLELFDENIETMGIFVYDLGPSEELNDGMERKPLNPMIKDLIRTPRPLRKEEFLGDVIVHKARQGREFKFVFKKKIFLQSEFYRQDNLPEVEGGYVSLSDPPDEQYNRLLYLQGEDEVITSGNLTVDSLEEVIKISSLSMCYNFAEEYPTDSDGFFELDCMSFIPEAWHDAQTEEKWATDLIAARDGVMAISDDEDLRRCKIEATFVNAIKSNKYYGGHMFCCKRAYINLTSDDDSFELPDDVTLCYREDGLHIFDSHEIGELYHFGFADIIRWGGSSRQFSLVLWCADTETTVELMLHTAQATDMAAIILDHINAIMMAQEE